jgi:hypothetical protein
VNASGLHAIAEVIGVGHRQERRHSAPRIFRNLSLCESGVFQRTKRLIRKLAFHYQFVLLAREIGSKILEQLVGALDGTLVRQSGRGGTSVVITCQYSAAHIRRAPKRRRHGQSPVAQVSSFRCINRLLCCEALARTSNSENVGRARRARRSFQVDLRSGRKPARTSSAKSFGCSKAAKCPPLSSLL